MSELLNNPLIATVLIFSLIAFGEWVSIITRARIPMLLTAMVSFLILSWTGIFPEDIMDRSQFAVLGSILIGPAIVHMGTLIPLSILRSQYKAVLIALSGLVVSGVLVLSIITFVFSYETAVAGIGPISGGVVALLITQEKLTEIGLSALVVIPALIVAFQGVLGMPLALNFMRRYAKKIVEGIDNGTFSPMKGATIGESISGAKKQGPLKSSTTIKLFLVFVVGAVGVILGEVTGIHYSLWCLGLGIVSVKFGILESESLNRANSFTLTMIGIILSSLEPWLMYHLGRSLITYQLFYLFYC